LRDVPARLVQVAHAPRSSYLRTGSYYGDDPSVWSAGRPSPPARAYRLEAEPDYASDPEPAWMTEPEPPDEFAVSALEPSFQKGDQVSHPAFGEGVVLDSQIVGGDEQVSVLFKGHPTPKKLSLSFAPLQRV
jgi:hypothetical protein